MTERTLSVRSSKLSRSTRWMHGNTTARPPIRIVLSRPPLTTRAVLGPQVTMLPMVAARGDELLPVSAARWARGGDAPALVVATRVMVCG